jgi:hypothetical protein
MPDNETKLFNIDSVEVFSAGTWNGDTYTEKDIEDMVKAFDETKEQVKPFLKLGHDDNQKLLQKDGYPAAGWISNLRKEGKKLVASFTDIPEKIYNLIKNKAYRTVSSEIYWNIDVNGKKYKKLLSGVALLGANLPSVSNLTEILGLYELNFEYIKTYALNSSAEKLEETDKMNEEKIEQLENEVKTYKEEKDAMQTELQSLKQYKEEMEAKILEIEKEKAENEINAFIDNMEKDNLCTPAMRPYIKELLGEDKKEYSINDKNLDKKSLLKEAIKLFKAVEDVNFDENSSEGDKKEDDSEEAINEKIEKYAQDNNVSYAKAYVAVLGKNLEE